MENGGAAQGFLNSIRGWYEFVAENMFIQSQGLLDQGLLSRFGGLGPQNSAMGCQIHLGRGFWPTQFYKTNCIPKSTRIRPWKSESQRNWAQEGAADLGERVACLARQGKAFQKGLGATFLGFLERIGFVADLGLLEQDASRNRFQNDPFKSPCNQE